MPNEHDETRALLELTLCRGVGPGTVRALMDQFDSASQALDASREGLMEVDGVGPATADSVRAGPGREAVQTELELMERFRVRLVPYTAEEYPRLLHYLGDSAPVLLRLRGDLRPEDRLAVAVVGSRRCSLYGRRQAGRIAGSLAGMGFTVVSGMAWGIDEAAHRAAVAAGGRTIAVLGSGLDVALRGDEAEFALEIAESGALLSELPMGTPPRAGNFPARNRIISGLALGTVVVEAASRSGSLITARLAGEQGRGVFAVPGPVDSATSRGTHGLIRDGAVLVEGARDVVDGLGPLDAPLDLPDEAEGAEAEPQSVQDARVMALNERERGVYDLLGARPRHIDEVLEQSGLPMSMVSSTLLTLEIRGLVQQHPGQMYSRSQ
jgi:DNA processing protein